MAGFLKQLYNKVTNRADVDWDELEADLIRADLGARTSMDIVDELQAMGRKVSADDIIDVCKQHIGAILPADKDQLAPRNGRKTNRHSHCRGKRHRQNDILGQVGLFTQTPGILGHAGSRRYFPGSCC